MAIKKRVKSLDGMDPGLAGMYVKDGDEFVLQIEGEEDTGALKRALERERESAKTSKAELADLKTRLQTIEDESNKSKAKAGDVTALEESYKKKLADAEANAKRELEARDQFIRQSLVDNVANGIAKEISTAPDLILPHVLKRLTVELVEGKPITRVLDKDGKPSAATTKELAQEFVANPSFAAVITASKAAGGGAQGGGPSGGATLDQFKNQQGVIQWGQLADAASKDPSLLKLIPQST
jgi:hypothetical protein